MPSVLVVDDDASTRDALVEILANDGHTVRATESARAATALVADDVPALVLLDAWLLRTEGPQFLDSLSRAGLAGVRVILCSTDRDAFQHPRVTAVLGKPYAVEKLLAMVRDHCA